jgi:hypothetical protein
MTDSTLTQVAARPVSLAVPASAPWWILRVGAALCFIGHGAFGFITKAAWIPYFSVIGIPEAWAWRLMPWVGAIDVMAGMAVLFAPRPLPLLYMVGWAAWTALLRPLAGEPVFEALERAGNYGVPAAFLLWSGIPRSGGALLTAMAPKDGDPTRKAVRLALQWTTCLLLAGHGALGAITGKPQLAEHYAVLNLPAAATPLVGWFELALAAAIAIRPVTALLLFAAAWKLATESLFIAAGAPIWEFVERAGSYAAPLALAAMQMSDRAIATPGRHSATSTRTQRT